MVAFNNSLNSTGITTRTAVYTVPATGVDSSTIVGVTICNISSTLNATFTVDVEGASIVANIVLTPGNGYSPLDGKIILLPNESLYVTSDIPVHATVSVMQYP